MLDFPLHSYFFFSSRRRHTRSLCDWSSDVCSSDLLAFHCVASALIDPRFAKRQLIQLGREWYMHPNGQFPAYEWNFGAVNPPVHAWAALKIYHLEQRQAGRGDRAFLERVFPTLIPNFTWWVNRRDAQARNVFQGCFLGLDNIG